VVALDTIVASRPTDPVDKPCHACWAFNSLTFIYGALDSLPAQERALRAWARLRPRSHVPWAALGGAYATQVRERDAEAAWTSWRRLAPQTAELRLPRAALAMRLGRFEEADRALANLARDGGDAVRGEALWWQAISLRMQGRLDEALRTVLRMRAESPSDLVMLLALGQVRLERGEFEQAARLFHEQSERSVIDWRTRLPAGAPDSAPGAIARALVWPIAHEAGAHAALGDTVLLGVLADSVRRLGALELHGRDRALHHHVRGLLRVAQGRDAEAVAELRRAIVSPTLGYTRTNLELGRALLRLGRAREAVAVLAPALRGGLEGSNYYVTHTELHEALAEAWDAAGVRDSARVHWRWVADAWRAGDAPFRTRADAARRRADGAAAP
jgi:tetratricopeptide (TPR) repeat protein